MARQVKPADPEPEDLAGEDLAALDHGQRDAGQLDGPGQGQEDPDEAFEVRSFLKPYRGRLPAEIREQAEKLERQAR